jgi:hypothetical protein
MLGPLRAGAVALATLFYLVASAAPPAARADVVPLRIAVDASQAAQRVYHVKVRIPVTPGPFTFVYPKWIPGYHGPVGPIEDAGRPARLGGNGTRARVAARPRRYVCGSRDVSPRVRRGSTWRSTWSARNRGTGMIRSAQHARNLAIVEYSNLVVYPQGATAEGTPSTRR